ncbi:hypothetical protein [Streptomyces bicolor]|nr:hypothetical protein [Streptomyces bicolor]
MPKGGRCLGRSAHGGIPGGGATEMYSALFFSVSDVLCTSDLNIAIIRK